MQRQLSETRIVRDLAHALTMKLVRKCIRYLQSLDATLSGDDSGLSNVWDEIGVQAQGEHSFYWDAYLETIDGFLYPLVEELSPFELDALWLQTREGEYWFVHDEGQRDHYPTFPGDVVAYLQGELLKKAMNWENKRIWRFLREDQNF